VFKVLSLKLDDRTYQAMERIRRRLNLPRRAYIRKAIHHYNALSTRKLLEMTFHKASRRLGAAHLKYLRETELLEDLPQDS